MVWKVTPTHGQQAVDVPIADCTCPQCEAARVELDASCDSVGVSLRVRIPAAPTHLKLIDGGRTDLVVSIGELSDAEIQDVGSAFTQKMLAEARRQRKDAA